MIDELRELSARQVLLFGGKGGVGKTTLAAIAARHFSESRQVILFTTDPASSLGDIVSAGANLSIEPLEAEALYARFLETHLDAFLEIADRGTYLDREELKRFFELSLPGIDELMAWMHIGELAEEHPQAMIVVDTAPTGHTLRMLASSEHFRMFAQALDAMQEKHRALVRQFTRRDVRDAMDAFIDDFHDRAQRRREMLTDPARSAFVPVFLSEPWVVEQTVRLISEVQGIDVPFAILNRAVVDPDCAFDEVRVRREGEARARLAPVRVVAYPRSCTPLWGRPSSALRAPSPRTAGRRGLVARVTFLAGKGGVGKTTCASAIALHLAQTNPDKRYTVISVDPAHSLRDVFAHEAPPPNLTVETIDTRAKWAKFRASIGEEIESAFDALAPRGMSLEYDSDAMQRMVEIAPPGADELFAVSRLAELAANASQAGVIVDTAPTGHFLRLLELPRTAGEWVREFMRLLLRYKELIPPGSLAEELIHASRSLKDLEATLHSDDASVIVVTRPEPIVIAETRRLLEELQRREIRTGGVIANYVTPENECACDRTMRAHEVAALATLDVTLTVERRDTPVVSLEALERLGRALVSGIEP